MMSQYDAESINFVDTGMSWAQKPPQLQQDLHMSDHDLFKILTSPATSYLTYDSHLLLKQFMQLSMPKEELIQKRKEQMQEYLERSSIQGFTRRASLRSQTATD